MPTANWYTSAGQPADSLGVNGDMAFDYTDRIIWGPKGNVTGGTWTGTATNATGPTGPAQLSGNGSPAGGYGQIGNGYCDLSTGNTWLKTSGGWSQVGNIGGPTGAVGPAGYVNLNALAGGFGPQPAAASLAVTATPTSIPAPGGTQPLTFVPISSSALLGLSGYNYCSTTATFTLYDQTAAAAVYSYNAPAGSFVTPQYSLSTYPLTAGHSYVWQISCTTGQTVAVAIWPFYAMPSTGTTQAMSMMPLMGLSAATAVSTTAITVGPYGASGVTPYYVPLRTAGLYAIQATAQAQGGTSASATMSFYGYSQPIAGGTVTTLGWSPLTITCDSVTRTILSTPSDASTFASGNRYFFQLKSSASISVTCQIQMYAYV